MLWFWRPRSPSCAMPMALVNVPSLVLVLKTTDSEAMREVEKVREEQEEENRRRQAERDRERSERLKAQEEASNSSPEVDLAASDQPDLADSGLVETPESQPKQRRPRQRKPKPEATSAEGSDQPTAAE